MEKDAQRKCLYSKCPSHAFLRLCQSYGILDYGIVLLSLLWNRVQINYLSTVLNLHQYTEEESYELD